MKTIPGLACNSFIQRSAEILLRLLAVTLVAPFLTGGCISGGSHPVALSTGAIEQRLQQILRAAEMKDFERLDSFHLYGPKFSKFTAGSASRLDAPAARQGEHEGLGRAQGLKMHTESLKIDAFDGAAVITCILVCEFSSASSAPHKDKMTLVLVRDRGEWKIAHEHISPVQSSSN